MIAAHEAIRSSLLSAGIPAELVDELLESFEDAKRRFYRNDLRPSAVEGGRFSEAAFRILQWATQGGKYTPIGRSLPRVDQLLVTLANVPGSNESVRLHIPRTLRLVYDIRNTRDAAHLADGIDPNLQDATLVIGNMDWAMAELIRLYHHATPNQAQRLIDDLVTKEVPVIQEINGFPLILRELAAGEFCLVHLYHRGSEGATVNELSGWTKPSMRRNLPRTLGSLRDKHLVHIDGDRIFVTILGERSVETRGLVEPA